MSVSRAKRLSLLRGLLPFGRPPPEFTPPRPDRPTWVVGDVHGRADLLEKMLGRIGPELAEVAAGRIDLVFAGDHVDRGPDSAAVLARLRDLSEAGAVCLMGNHEAMLTAFLDDPERDGALWLMNGGDATLASYGVIRSGAGRGGVSGLAAALAARLPVGLDGWLRDLPRLWRSGSLVVAHAGLDPRRPPEAQRPRDLIWGHGRFRRAPRRDGLWVAHGHWVVPAPSARDGRIAVDTGAGHGGSLSAARIEAGEISFVQVR